MKDRLLTVSDIQERYQCSPNTARNYIRRMEHMEKPLRVRESVLREWEANRTRSAGESYLTRKRRKVVPMIPTGGKHIVSRVRPQIEGR